MFRISSAALMSRISLELLLPRHRDQPIHVIAAYGGLGGHGRHQFQALQLGNGLLVHILGHSGVVDFLFQFLDFILFAASQFLLDGL